MYKMKEDREIGPRSFSALASSTLYERRCVCVSLRWTRERPRLSSLNCLLLRFGPYFVEPVVAGLEEDGTPFIAGADLIGCLNFAKVTTSHPRTPQFPFLPASLADSFTVTQDFVVSGTASSKLFGMAEALWEPDLEADALFETISQSLLNVRRLLMLACLRASPGS